MKYQRMPIEIEAPEEKGYNTIKYNLAESSVRDKYLKDFSGDFSNVLLHYGEHWGTESFRKAILHQEEGLIISNILTCPSAATGLFIVHTALLDLNSHLIVIRPNYGTNLETPRAIGCSLSVIDLDSANQYQPSVEKIEQSIQPNTKIISITSPQNPTGIVIDGKIIEHLITLCEKNNIWLLIDETYRDLNFQSDLIPYWATKSDKVISVCSLSKAFGVPGIRTGWIINKNHELMQFFLAAKEQIIISNSVLDEAVATHILENKSKYLIPTHQHIRANFEILKQWLETNQYFDCQLPDAGVVCFLLLKVTIDMDKFYNNLYEQYATVVGPGHWFEQSKKAMRIGFGYPTAQELSRGLEHIKLCIESLLNQKT